MTGQHQLHMSPSISSLFSSNDCKNNHLPPDMLIWNALFLLYLFRLFLIRITNGGDHTRYCILRTLVQKKHVEGWIRSKRVPREKCVADNQQSDVFLVTDRTLVRLDCRENLVISFWEVLTFNLFTQVLEEYDAGSSFERNVLEYLWA